MDDTKIFGGEVPLTGETEKEMFPTEDATSTAETEPLSNDPKPCVPSAESSDNGSTEGHCAASEFPMPEPPDDPLRDLPIEIEKIRLSLSETAEASKKAAVEIREIHKLYHNEFAHRLKSMQDELDEYHKADRGRAFDDILSAIARIYGNNESLIDEIEDPKVRKSVKYMLLDLLDLLEEYGIQRLKSNPGDKRNTRHCQVLERIPTDDMTKHDTIVASHNSGFFIDNRTIIKELVDVYLYSNELQTQVSEPPLPDDGPQQHD